MFSFSFKNRIAFNYLISTALMVLFVFVIIYNIVSYTVNSHVDANIAHEVQDHLQELGVDKENVCVIDPMQWHELEYRTLTFNPVFVQILDAQHKRVGKTPNLKEHNLHFVETVKDFQSFDTKLAGKAVRQVQFPVIHNGQTAGYILIAMSLEEANVVLRNLSRTLWISYPVILILLFIAARFIAGRSIRPISAITQTASAITRENLQARIELPQNKDELYVLSRTINELLGRIENAIDREKQFTSDASHELRTPLAVVKGTLEVLIRKPRTQKEYEEKIRYCVSEVNRLNHLVDQLLLLARFEGQKVVRKSTFNLDETLLQSLERFSAEIGQRGMSIDFTFDRHFPVHSDPYLVSTIIENILSNALKYSPDGARLTISLDELGGGVNCTISDNGIGIPKDELQKIYGQFYRAANGQHTAKGTGLGLSIVKRLSELLGISIAVDSAVGAGTSVRLTFG